MKGFDFHFHFPSYARDLNKEIGKPVYSAEKIDPLIYDAIEYGVIGINAMSGDTETSEFNLKLKERYKNKIYFLVSAGIQPWLLLKKLGEKRNDQSKDDYLQQECQIMDDFYEKETQGIKQFFEERREEIDFVGEIGVDATYQNEKLQDKYKERLTPDQIKILKDKFHDIQFDLFSEMLNLSINYEKTPIIHSRGFEKEVLTNLKNLKNRPKKIVLHSFQSSDYVKDAIDMGCYISAAPERALKSGFKNMVKVLNSEHIKLDRLLPETDGSKNSSIWPSYIIDWTVDLWRIIRKNEKLGLAHIELEDFNQTLLENCMLC